MFVRSCKGFQWATTLPNSAVAQRVVELCCGPHHWYLEISRSLCAAALDLDGADVQVQTQIDYYIVRLYAIARQQPLPCYAISAAWLWLWRVPFGRCEWCFLTSRGCASCSTFFGMVLMAQETNRLRWALQDFVKQSEVSVLASWYGGGSRSIRAFMSSSGSARSLLMEKKEWGVHRTQWVPEAATKGLARRNR